MRFLSRIVVLICAATTVTAVHAADGASVFQRGIGVHRLLNWASVSPADNSLYSWPPFATAEHYIPDDLIAAVRKSGFDFVRLTVDPGPFLQMKGERRDALDTILRSAIRRFRARNLALSSIFIPLQSRNIVLSDLHRCAEPAVSGLCNSGFAIGTPDCRDEVSECGAGAGQRAAGGL